jgi:hypothetical protein
MTVQNEKCCIAPVLFRTLINNSGQLKKGDNYHENEQIPDIQCDMEFGMIGDNCISESVNNRTSKQ